MKSTLALQGERRRVRQFATLVDGGRVRARHDLQPLANLAAHLQPPPAEPLPEFVAYLRDRLVFATSEVGAAPPELAPPSNVQGWQGTRPWKELVATAAALSLMTGIGAAAASSRALPGDGLYPLKRSIESMQISLADSEKERAEELLERSQHRLAEAELLAASDGNQDAATQELIDGVLAAMQADMLAGSRALLKVYADSGETDALVTLDQFTVESQARLAALAPALATPTRARVVDLLDDLASVHAEVAAVSEKIEASGEPQQVPFEEPGDQAPPEGSTEALPRDKPLPTREAPTRDSSPASAAGESAEQSRPDREGGPSERVPQREPREPQGPARAPVPVPVGVSPGPDAPPQTVARPAPDLTPDRLPVVAPIIRPGPDDRPEPAPPATQPVEPVVVAPAAPAVAPVLPAPVAVVPPVVVPPVVDPPGNGNVLPPVGGVVVPPVIDPPGNGNVLPPVGGVVVPPVVVPPVVDPPGNGNVAPPVDAVVVPPVVDPPPQGNVVPPVVVFVLPPVGKVDAPAGGALEPLGGGLGRGNQPVVGVAPAPAQLPAPA